jgi:hypothetical protein
LVVKPAIQMPATAEECGVLMRWAQAQPDGWPLATVDELARHLDFLGSTLPRQATDAESGRMRAAVYARFLASYSNSALAYMSRRACETLDWFPTPRQCLDILKDYQAPITEKETALRLCGAFWGERFDAFLSNVVRADKVITQADIDAVPEQWRRIAVERGALRLMADGTFVVRRAALVWGRADEAD